jgi:hypothetical protein
MKNHGYSSAVLSEISRRSHGQTKVNHSNTSVMADALIKTEDGKRLLIEVKQAKKKVVEDLGQRILELQERAWEVFSTLGHSRGFIDTLRYVTIASDEKKFSEAVTALDYAMFDTKAYVQAYEVMSGKVCEGINQRAYSVIDRNTRQADKSNEWLVMSILKKQG